MALLRSSVSRRGSKNGTEKEEEEQENNGYIQVLVKPLEPGNCSYVLSWLGVNSASFSPQQVTIFYVSAILLSTFCLYQVIRCDFGSLFQRLCGLFVPMFSIICAFYWLSLYLRKTWSVTSVYILFISCFVGEAFAQLLFCGIDNDSSPAATSESRNSLTTISHPSVIFIVLLVISTASIFSSLEATYSATVILLVSFTRFLSCSTLIDLPQSLRPYVSYSCGLAGIFVSKYMETVLRPPINNYMTQDGKIPVIKRRRSSSSSAHAFQTHRSTRRTSLPALIQKSQNSSASYDAAIIGEAHGLITDMLADSSLPPHVVSGLRAVSNLLKPPESHSSIHKQRVSPLVSLTESTSYGSDSEENPYTGERPSSLPKRLRRSLPPSLIRRMSTSTWTTTTSATGMPTLEPEPCRMRSSSFRHSRDSTPNTSPQGSRSNSPSPSSPTTVVLTIPKSRSFSMASPVPVNQSQQKRFSRKSTPMHSTEEVDRQISPLAKLEVEVEELDEKHITLPKDPHFASLRRLNITSDYESNDSPSSSDHSDNVVTSEDLSVSPPRKDIFKDRVRLDSGSHIPPVVEEKVEEKSQTSQSESEHLFDISDIDNCSLLDVAMLNEWDFPIFDLSETEGNFILTKVAYRLFTEVGLFETFRIPVPEFLKYFHALEVGYRDKPYHNRVHATDVLHGVYYITTQPIPGFQQVSISDIMSRHGSSGESGDNIERSSFTQRHSVSGDDSYGIMGANIPPLELMALYTAAAMHDYDHPGRTNAFLVATHAPQAVLYNDRSVLENHHAASAWNLFLSDRNFNFLSGLDQSEFKRFRFLVIESILATDLKRHFEILAEFNAKVNDDDAPGVDWTVETDRLLASQMVIKIADINGPAKRRDLHMRWTMSISEEFYEQGDEESRLGMPISPYMDRRNQQLAKLQETFINHLVAPLCNAMVTGGLIPGTWVDDESDGEGMSDTDKGDSACKDTEDEDNDDTDQEVPAGAPFVPKKTPRKVNCILTKNMKENHDYWAKVVEAENIVNQVEKEAGEDDSELKAEKKEMEPITEESESPTVKESEQSVEKLNIKVDKNTNDT